MTRLRRLLCALTEHVPHPSVWIDKADASPGTIRPCRRCLGLVEVLPL